MNRARKTTTWAVLLNVATATVGCGGSGGEKLTELQRVRSEPVDVVLLSPRDGLRHGKDTFTIEFRSKSGGNLFDVGNVRGSATMPMPGSSPMFGTIDVTRTDTAGRYAVTSQFDMAGTWRATIEWDGPGGKGSVTFPESVQ